MYFSVVVVTCCALDFLLYLLYFPSMFFFCFYCCCFAVSQTCACVGVSYCKLHLEGDRLGSGERCRKRGGGGLRWACSAVFCCCLSQGNFHPICGHRAAHFIFNFAPFLSHFNAAVSLRVYLPLSPHFLLSFPLSLTLQSSGNF